jgi:hypothetical protein
MAQKTPAIATPQGKLSFRMGAPPEFGKPGTTSVAVGEEGPGVAVDEEGVVVGVAVGAAGCRQITPLMLLLSRVTAPV